ncbi:MAG: hypothetical protein U5O15_07255 [Candidatus Krumholzibacteriota bacterium]|nr:hypothetical protein [Candidatus Krumholzibacteriota bacterium]
MKIRRLLQAALSLTLIFSVIITSGCILDPKETTDQPVNEEPWPDRTEKDHCIEIIDRVYEEKDIEKYKELLLEPDQRPEPEFSDGYIWYNQPTDVSEYGEILSYQEEWMGTQGIFNNAVGTLNITLSEYSGLDSDWTEESGMGDGFWSKKVNYFFTFELPDPDNPGETKIYNGDSDVEFFIGPDPEDPEKYLLYRARDVPK